MMDSPFFVREFQDFLPCFLCRKWPTGVAWPVSDAGYCCGNNKSVEVGRILLL